MTELDERIRHELERLHPSTDGLEPTLRRVRRRRRNRRMAGGGVGLALTLALVAGLFAVPGRSPVPAATAPSHTAVTQTTGPSEPTPSPSGSSVVTGFVATCSVAVDVDGPLPQGWQQNSVFVGPLAFVGIRVAASEPPSDFDGEGGWKAKALVLVTPGHQVTVSVPESEPDVGLIYDPSEFATTHALADGERSVTFQACPPNGSTQPASGAPEGTEFAGGFLAPGPTCVSLDVQPEGGQPTRVRIPLGAGTCGSPA